MNLYKVWPEIWYGCRLSWKNDRPTFVEFDLLSWTTARPGEGDTLLFDEDEAEVVAQGSLKWDGCMDFDFVQEGQSYHHHHCGLNGIRSLCAAFERLYLEVKGVLPGFDSGLAQLERPHP